MAKQRIAVLGGGVGALSAVFAITDRAGWADQYDITVYQLGWRLGGKGATGRDQARADRILEHGYHMLFGFYDNTFGTLRRCYAELGRDPGQPISEVVALSTADELLNPDRYAFHRQSTAVLQQQLADGSWHNLVFEFPLNIDLPGDAGELPGPLAYIEMALEFLARVVGDVTIGPSTPPPDPPARPSWWQRIEAAIPHLVADLDPAAHSLNSHRDHLDLIRKLARHLVDSHPAGIVGRAIEDVAVKALVDLLREYLRLVWDLTRDRLDRNWDAFKLWTASDFVCTTIIGFIVDDVIGNGFDSVDDINFWEWIAKHGTVPEGTVVTNGSCWMQAAYDSSFAYEQGDTTAPRTADKPLLGRPVMGTGTALRGAMRLGLGFKGAMAWKFQTGCGEALVAPLFQVLRRRGVKFEFFSKVEHLGVGDDNGPVVDTLRIQRQVDFVDPAKGYEPLIEVKGVPCWPAAPLWDQIKNAEAVRMLDFESDWIPWPGVETKVLRRGPDFDHVLLAISLGALPNICGDLIAASPAWKAMVDAVPTVRTQALQVWVNRDLESLGWTAPNAPVGTGVEPMDTWADMGQLTRRETWPADNTPKGVSYFCCAMPDDPHQPPVPNAAYPATQLALVRQTSLDFLNTQSAHLWPNAQTANGFDWEVLVSANRVSGERRLDEQFIRANIDASERYVLSPPGSAKYRLKPGESGFRNLTLAGDWTDNTINAGCMEATVMSGLAASRAIAGYPERIVGEEDFGTAGPRRSN
ncbi:MAG TPA: NAD(P)-binding protein [Vicinamibacterales bacterium]